MSAASSARVLQVEGAIHTSEVAVNGRSASPWAAAGTAAARVRSSKVYGLRSKGILLAKEGNGDLSEVSGEHHKAWRMCYMRCEHLFTPLTDPIIPVAPDPPSAPRAPWAMISLVAEWKGGEAQVSRRPNGTLSASREVWGNGRWLLWCDVA